MCFNVLNYINYYAACNYCNSHLKGVTLLLSQAFYECRISYQYLTYDVEKIPRRLPTMCSTFGINLYLKILCESFYAVDKSDMPRHRKTPAPTLRH